MEKSAIARIGALGLDVLLVLAVTLGCFYVVEPGERGVHVTLGTMSEQFVAPQVVGAGSNILLPLAKPAE